MPSTEGSPQVVRRGDPPKEGENMRRPILAVVVVLGALLPAAPAAATAAPAGVLLADVTHALDGRMLTITGRVTNAGPAPTDQLVIDAAGFGPSGDLVALGSDGIPWRMARGQTEQFRIGIPLERQLVREYTVQVFKVGAAIPLASTRRSVDVALYRDHMRTLIELRGAVLQGVLIVRVTGPALPVARVTVEATVLVFDPVIEAFRPLLMNLEFDPNRSATAFLGSPRAFLVSLRLVDLRLVSTWSD